MSKVPAKMMECRILLERCDDHLPTSVPVARATSPPANRKSNCSNYSPCPICRKEISKQSLKLHYILRKHTKRKAFMCSFCPDEFYSSAEMDRHVRSHTHERPHICSICSLGFKIFESGYSHEKTHFKSKHFTTSVTYKDFQKSKRTLRPSFECKTCGVEFKDFQGILDHIKPFVRCLKCDNCGTSFASARDKTAHQDETGDFECKFCYKVFTSPCDHRKHKQLILMSS